MACAASRWADPPAAFPAAVATATASPPAASLATVAPPAASLATVATAVSDRLHPPHSPCPSRGTRQGFMAWS
jgi:hypothetical protein